MDTRYYIYALEIEKMGSITQAADNLYMTQPTLSKAVKDMETSLGFTVFRRTSKGVIPTQKGNIFLEHARKIVQQIEKMEYSLQSCDLSNQLFSIAIPHADYIAQATAKFVCSFDNRREMELDVMETSSMRVIDAVSDGHYVLGIIRYHMEDEDYFLKLLHQKGLQHEVLWQSQYVVLMSEDHPLAGQSRIHRSDLDPYIEIKLDYGNVPYLHADSGINSNDNSKRILLYDRAMQIDLLRMNPLAYSWTSATTRPVMERNRLVQKKCKESREFKDLLISRAGYRYSRLDRTFINQLSLQRNEVAYSGDD